MDLRQLRYFVAVAEELHFGRAATRAGIAQPPLTQQIQKLEAELGCQLLVRGRKTVLTDAGSVLLDEARRILQQSEQAVDATRRAARGETGQLRVGAPPSIMLSALPAIIRKYHRLYPGVQFSLLEMSTSAIEQALSSGQIDAGFLRETQLAPPFTSEKLLNEAVVAVLPAKHELTAARDLSIVSLRGQPFIFFPRRLGPAFYDRLISFCTRAGFVPDVVQEATQWQSIVCLVEAGMGVSLAPACVQRFRWPGVVYRPLARVHTAVSACWRLDCVSPHVTEFLRLARAEFAKV
jgi:DNA-binding transcriptional LysR family regulator